MRRKRLIPIRTKRSRSQPAQEKKEQNNAHPITVKRYPELLPAHFLLTTFGSLGDLHPYMAVGLALQARGHRVTIATSEFYRAKIEGEGLGFRPVRPDFGLAERPEVMAKAFHPRKGSEYILRHLILPYIEQTYEDTLAAALDADVLVGHIIAYTTSTVAEYLHKPWMGVILQPAMLFSIYEAPKGSAYAHVYPLIERLGPRAWKQVFALARVLTRRWGAPINTLRTRLGLAPLRNPIMDDMFSPHGTQAWFSPLLANRQPDWPRGLELLGFPVYDKLDAASTRLDPALERFLDAGPPPVVFTLGSSAVYTAGSFYEESARAAIQGGFRAVLLTGPDPRNKPSVTLPDSIHVAEYAPYSLLFPRAGATVHQGGVGTTAQAMLSGKPMLFVPFSHDQPDNALRCERLGIARTLTRSQYKAKRISRELTQLFTNPSYAANAAIVGQSIRAEFGITRICEGLEKLLPAKRAQ